MQRLYDTYIIHIFLNKDSKLQNKPTNLQLFHQEKSMAFFCPHQCAFLKLNNRFVSMEILSLTVYPQIVPVYIKIALPQLNLHWWLPGSLW